jgi:hypothetical protein
MAEYGLTLKREATALAWGAFIGNATGESPIVNRFDDAITIDWKPGQAKKMRDYLTSAMDKEPTPNDLNVNVNLAPVLVPILIKKYWIYVLGFGTAAYVIGRLSRK